MKKNKHIKTKQMKEDPGKVIVGVYGPPAVSKFGKVTLGHSNRDIITNPNIIIS